MFSLLILLAKVVVSVVMGLCIGGIGIVACGTGIGIPALGVAALIFMFLL